MIFANLIFSISILTMHNKGITVFIPKIADRKTHRKRTLTVC